MNNNNSSAIGQKVVDMREKHKNDIIIDANCLLTFENVDGYTVCVTNNDSVIAELKYDKTAEGAIEQIKNRKYTEKLQAFSGEILLVGINYNEKSKRHECRIETVVK